MRRLILMTLLILILIVPVLLSQRPVGPLDLAAELPRIPPVEPRDAPATFKLAPGFRIELVASEPLIRSPVAIDFDEDGRLFVAEFPEYNLHDDPTFKEKGAIKRLIDADGDGVYESATVFADSLAAPTAVACWKGGVFVGSVPHLLECKDTDGDGKAEVREIVYTGFERDKAGEGMLNSIRWGLDNRFHLSTSSAGGTIRAGDGLPVNVRSRFVIFDPATRRFEAVSAHGQHGMSMNDWSHPFVCDNSNPIHHVVYDGRYAARNPFAVAPAVAVNIHERAGDPNLLRTSAFEPWRVVRTKLRISGVFSGPTEGGRVGGHFTGATGVTIYRGDAFPPECRGQAFVGEVSNNLVHRMTLSPKGVSYVAKRADEGREFLASKDNWFRPCQFANGPDGCLYVVDMYRELIETVESIPPDIRKHLHPRSGVDRGRIWRIVPEGHIRRAAPRLSKATTAELVALLDHANGWHRDTASRLLMERHERTAIAPLTVLAKAAKTPQGRVHALSSLVGFDALTEDLILAALDDDAAPVREHALKLSERFADRPAVRASWAKRVADPDVRVRCQLAFSLGAANDRATTDALAQLAETEGGDRWLRFAILSSSNGRAAPLVQRLLETAAAERPFIREMIADLIATIAQSGREDEIAAVLQTIESRPANQAAAAREMTALLLAKLTPALRDRIKSASVQKVLASMLDEARVRAVDARLTPDERSAATRNLRLGKWNVVQALCVRLLTPTEPEALQKAVVDVVSSFDAPDAATVLLDVWPNMSPAVRAAATEALVARPASLRRLFERIEGGAIKISELDPARVALLRQTGDGEMRTRLDRVLAAAPKSKRGDVIAAYKEALDKTGDVDRGRVLFRKHCIACHRREGVGEQIGAELAGIQQRGPEFLLVNILDPNREVLPKFLAYQAQTDAGRSITGMIQSETATSITLRRLDGASETVLRANLESLRSLGLSFMPEGFEAQISPTQMADLVEYLLQTP